MALPIGFLVAKAARYNRSKLSGLGLRLITVGLMDGFTIDRRGDGRQCQKALKLRDVSQAEYGNALERWGTRVRLDRAPSRQRQPAL